MEESERNEPVIQIPYGVFQIISHYMKIMILQSLDYKDLISLCSTGGSFSGFCRKYSFRIWKGIVKRDFHMTINGNKNYLKIYKDLLEAEDYYKNYKEESLWNLISEEDENYHGVKWSLLVKNVDPSVENNKAIRYASYYSHLEVVKVLLEDPRVDPSAFNNETIRWAIKKGHVEVIRELLKDSRVDPSNNDNEAIIIASNNGHINIVELLLNDKRIINSLSEELYEKYSNIF